MWISFTYNNMSIEEDSNICLKHYLQLFCGLCIVLLLLFIRQKLQLTEWSWGRRLNVI